VRVRAACIDIGSNTTRLLVADCAGGSLVEVYQERAFTRIGQGLDASGLIREDKIREVVQVVAAQMAAARDQGVQEFRGVATAAIRAAGNGAELVEAISRDTGLEVEILSGEAEARLAFLGAAATLADCPEGELGVIDVGGGSSEVVVGTFPGGVCWWESVGLGSGGLTDRFLCSDPPTAAELAAVRAEIADALAALKPPRPELAVAVGGSATSLGRLAGPVLDAAAFERSLALLAGAPSAVVAERYLIDAQRARLLPAGLLILQAAGELLGAVLTVGRGGIREGVLLEALRE
jgi:exopolyphosphatase/guanosine-5'-triphosphate,3'-diphosphate pyrophosphatase